MKIKPDLKKVLIAVSAIVAMVVGSAFLLMYADRNTQHEDSDFDGSNLGSFVITPDNMGKQGELMFAYIGENNYIYNLDDESKPLVEQPASMLLYASDDTVLYIAPAEINKDHYSRESVIQELQIGEHENTLYTIATVSVDPCWSANDEVVYFIKDDNPKQLYTFEPLTSTTEMAAEFDEEVVGLRISSDGLLVTVSSGEEKLYVPLSKSITEAYYNSQGSRVLVCEQYDLILSPSGELFYRWLGSKEATKIADDVVVAKGYQDNEIFYIQNTPDGKKLNAYYVSEAVIKELVALPDNIKPQLTVSAQYAFLIDSYNVVYKYDIDVNEFNQFTIVEDEVLNPMISVFDYRLMVYDLSREMDQTFVYVKDAMVNPTESEIAQINAHIEEMGDKTAEFMYPCLEMASIGGEVQELQSTLMNLGYMNTVPTGIYDVNTTVAVQQIQFALGLNQSGIADNEFRTRLSENAIPPNEGYPILSASSEGVLVRDVQSRLRTLGYRVDEVNGSFDKETISELQNFATLNSIEYDGGIVQGGILDVLFSSKAVLNDKKLSLEEGDCHDQVTLLNQRLKTLGYLAGAVNPSYDKKTLDAVNLFVEVNDVDFTSDSVELINYMFSDEAIQCPSDLSPKALNDTMSSTIGQVISDRQLKIIRKWLTKQFAVNHTDKQAVKRLQMQLVRLGYLSLQEVSMIYDKNTFDAIVVFQTDKGLVADGVVSKSTLTEIFATEINRHVETEEE